jgi:hypothetical protein
MVIRAVLPRPRKSRGSACEWSSSYETYNSLPRPDVIYDAAVLNNLARLLMSAALASPITK